MELLPIKQQLLEKTPSAKPMGALIPEFYGASSVSDFQTAGPDVLAYERANYDERKTHQSRIIQVMHDLGDAPHQAFGRLIRKPYHPVREASALILVPLVQHRTDRDPHQEDQVTIFDATAEQTVTLLPAILRKGFNKLIEDQSHQIPSRRALRDQSWRSDVLLGANYYDNEKFNEFVLITVFNRNISESEKAYFMGAIGRLALRGVGLPF